MQGLKEERKTDDRGVQRLRQVSSLEVIMSKMTTVDNDLKLAVQRFIREYNNEVNYLKAELVKYRRKTERLEAKPTEKGATDDMKQKQGGINDRL